MSLRNPLFVYTILFLIILSQKLSATSLVNIPKTEQSPHIDGQLSEPIWRQAATFTDFQTISPDFGLPPSEKTEFYLTYNQNYFYVAFYCYDQNPQQIKASLSKRDDIGNDDWVAFCVDADNDELNSYFFVVNPLGIQADGTLNSEGNPNPIQDLIWQSAARRVTDGYIVEMAIPFQSLRFSNKETLQMGFKVARFIGRKSEEVDYPVFYPDKGAALAQFQKIEVRGIKNKRTFEILPALTVNKNDQHQEGNMINGKVNSDWSLTSKIGITSGLVLDATYNPDFSQIETDVGQIDANLRFSLFFPEKRTFFLEGQEWMGFAANPSEMPLRAIVNTRSIVDPLVGIKLSGKIGRSNLLSAMYALDEFPEQSTHFSVLRYGRTFKNDSYIGAFFTGRSDKDQYNYVGGSDGRIRLNQNSTIEFHGFGSSTNRPDWKNVSNGTALGSIYSYSSRNWQGSIGLHRVSAGFNTEVGYLTRTGVTIIPMNLERSFYFSKGLLQRITPYYWARHLRDHQSNLLETFNVIGVNASFPRQSRLNISAWLANEVFAGKRFSRNAIRIRMGSQPINALAFEADLRLGKQIFYDPEAPYQGWGKVLRFGLLIQPNRFITSGMDISYSDFFRSSNDQKIYDFTIIRNQTTFQFNRFLFFRSILEYNTFHKRLSVNFLLSFTYIPGTVVHLGYGALYEKLEWDYINTQRNLFFKASYLWRI